LRWGGWKKGGGYGLGGGGKMGVRQSSLKRAGIPRSQEENEKEEGFGTTIEGEMEELRKGKKKG